MDDVDCLCYEKIADLLVLYAMKMLGPNSTAWLYSICKYDVVLSSHAMKCLWNWNVFSCYVICHVM